MILLYDVILRILYNETGIIRGSDDPRCHTYNDYILLLIKEEKSKPRLYKINKTLELNKFLNKYKSLQKDGQDVVVNIDYLDESDSLGMYIESIQKKLPPK